jgi:endoglucanase
MAKLPAAMDDGSIISPENHFMRFHLPIARPYVAVALFLVAIGLVAACAPRQHAKAIHFSDITVGSIGSISPLPPLHADNDGHMVDQRGQEVILRGCNLGNYLLNEMWMLRWPVKDSAELVNILNARFGEPRATALMETYRANFFTARDAANIRSFGFNVVRLPVDYRLLQSDASPYAMLPGGLKWIDHALDLCEREGIYVILDLHGAPGRQSVDQCTGEAGRNQLFADATDQQRTIAIWTALAQRYQNRSSIAAYDLLNEPFGDMHGGYGTRVKSLMERIVPAIRATGDQHVLLLPQTIGDGIFIYHKLAEHNFYQVGFTDHFYPGHFGSPPTVWSYAQLLDERVPQLEAYIAANHAPFLAGEFNVGDENVGGAAMLRKMYDTFAAQHWMATLWAYKLLRPEPGLEADSWGMVGNADPLPKIDPKTATYDELMSYMQGLATMRLAVNEPMRAALAAKAAPVLELPTRLVTKRVPVVDVQPPAGWSGSVIGKTQSTTGSGVQIEPDGTWTVAGDGTDIFGPRDDFYYLHRPIAQAPAGSRLLDVTLRVSDFLPADTYSKVGLMLRAGTDANAPCVMVNCFADGTVAVLHRDVRGGIAEEKKIPSVCLPLELRVKSDGMTAQFSARTIPNGTYPWIDLGSCPLPSGIDQVGIAISGHGSTSALARCSFDATPEKPGVDDRGNDNLLPELPQALEDADFFDSRGAPVPDGPMKNTSWAIVADRKMVGENVYEGMTAPILVEARHHITLFHDVDVKPGKRYQLALRYLAETDNGVIGLRVLQEIGGRWLTMDQANARLKSPDRKHPPSPPSVIATQTTPAADRVRITLEIEGGEDPGATASAALLDAELRALPLR